MGEVDARAHVLPPTLLFLKSEKRGCNAGIQSKALTHQGVIPCVLGAFTCLNRPLLKICTGTNEPSHSVIYTLV